MHTGKTLVREKYQYVIFLLKNKDFYKKQKKMQ